MEDIKITVLIPTYNRKEDLEATLIALSQQTDNRFRVLISDNSSNYSIEELIKKEFSEEFISRVEVYHQRFNIGAACNIIGMLALCKTEYGWLLGDDDCVQQNAIEQIYNVIKKYPYIGAFWFSIDDKIKTDFLIKEMRELKKFLVELDNSGDFIFCSNKIYKVDEVSSFMDLTYRFAYTRIPQCFPLIEMLKNGNSVGIIGGKILAKHRGFENGEVTWDVSKAVLGLCTLMDYPTGLDWKSHCQFVRSVMFDPKFVLISYFKSKSFPWNHRAYLKSVYHRCYRYCYRWNERCVIKIVYWISSIPIVWKAVRKFKGIS